jgi:hypothetical protein
MPGWICDVYSMPFLFITKSDKDNTNHLNIVTIFVDA